ncbi:MAG TPA: DoxX family protein [Microthrixaceae bacterium]|jgi:putative oxidoreductase|nr:DoxX family protein [Microthrixaceae bacterium]
MDEFNVIMLVLRVIAGPTIFLHGYNKMFRGGKIPGTAGWFDSIGMKPNGTIHAYMAAITEMGCGALILLGLLTPFGAAGVIGTMVVAGWTVHRDAFFIVKSGWEIVMVMATLFFAIGALGAGEWSLDHALFPDGVFYLNGWAPILISLVLGVGSGVMLLATCFRPDAVAKD